MKSQSQRIRDPAAAPEGELVAPFSRPCYGAYSVARRRWRKPLPAVIADVIANTHELSERLKRGILSPDVNRARYQQVYDEMCQCTDAQLAALEALRSVGGIDDNRKAGRFE